MFEQLAFKKQLKEGLNIVNFLNLPPTSERAALIVITPYQSFNFELIYSDSHGASLTKLFKLIYKDFEGFSEDEPWNNYINNYGNIVIALTTGSYALVFLPKKCNTYQLEGLINVNNIIKNNNIKSKKYYFPNTNIEDLDYTNLDVGIKYLYERLDDNIKSNEIILKLNSKTK